MRNGAYEVLYNPYMMSLPGPRGTLPSPFYLPTASSSGVSNRISGSNDQYGGVDREKRGEPSGEECREGDGIKGTAMGVKHYSGHKPCPGPAASDYNQTTISNYEVGISGNHRHHFNID
jgi:hypothetical protein